MTAADPWIALETELDAWQAAGRRATLWWRDDDAAAPSPELDRLLALAGGTVPLALAVVPEPAGAALADRIADAAHVSVLQHGWAHRNHRPPGERSAEYAGDRPLDRMADELVAGQARLAALFGERALPILVPPWNRIDAALVARLPALGYRGLSTFGSRTARGGTSCLAVNTHVDPIAWRAGRGFVGDTKAIAELVGHLAERRHGRVDPTEPTGLLTHHRDHDAPLWDFVATLFRRTANHPAVHWLTAETAFAATPDRPQPRRC